jgi:hypothetical protein
MDTLLYLANKAKLRLQFGLTLQHCLHWFLYLAGVIFLLAIVDRFGVVPMMPWAVIWICTGGIAVALIIAQWNARSCSLIEAAAEIDDRMQLHDRISSALAITPIGNPFSDALLVDALATVNREQVQASLSKKFPIQLPKSFVWLLAMALATFVVLWSPQWGFFNGNNGNGVPAAVIASKENIESSVDAVLEQIKEHEELSDELQEELDELEATTANSLVDPDSMRRDALKKMTDLQKRLDEMMQDESALAFEEMLRKMQGLELPKNGSTLPMVAAMKNGDMNKAKKEFDKLQEKMESKDLSDEEREELSKQLEELAKQFEKLSKANDALASALSSAGLNGALANNPEAAMKAIKNAKNLTGEQKKKLLELLKAQQQANQQCKNVSEGCKKCASNKSGSLASSELEKMQAMQQFMTKAELAKTACKKAGACMGQGTGGKGQGNGGSNPVQQTDTTMVAERTPVSTLDGTIIAKQLFEGGMLTAGESTSAVKETVLTQRREAEQAITDEQVPRKYHDLLRHYFGQLEELTEPSQHDDTENSE